MGSSSSNQYDREFNPQIYTAQGVPLHEVLQIKKTFDSLKDDDNYNRVSVEKIQELYVDSYDRKFLDQALQGRDYISFDEFFQINSQIIKTRKMQFPDMEVDGLEPNATCGCCFSITNKDAGYQQQPRYQSQFPQFQQPQQFPQQFQQQFPQQFPIQGQQIPFQSLPPQQIRYY